MRSAARWRPRRRTGLRLLGAVVVAVLIVTGWRVVGRDLRSERGTASGAPTPIEVGDVLTKTALVGAGIRAAPPDAVMTARTSGVRLLRFGTVRTYGGPDAQRSAAPGRHLIAFAAEPIAGESGDNAPVLSLRVDGVERGPLVITPEYLVASVVDTASSVDLVLTEGLIKQSISLLTGRPAATNIAVCARQHRAAVLNVTRPVTVRVATVKGTFGITSGTLTLRMVSLSYWAADGSRPSGPDRAFLHVEATVRLAGDREPYGAEAQLVSVQAAGAAVPARNAAANPASSVDDVVEVPAGTTTGVITYGGSLGTSAGTVSVVTPVRVPFEIPAG